MKKLNGITFVELMLVILLITSIVIITAPTFTQFLKGPELTYKANKLAQSLQNIQTQAFKTHRYFRVIIDKGNNKVQTDTYLNDWIQFETQYISERIEIDVSDNLNSLQQLIYGPNGNAFLCNNGDLLSNCINQPLLTTEYIKLIALERHTQIDFLPKNGYVSYNINTKQ